MSQPCIARGTGLLCFNKRKGGCILKQHLLIMSNLRLSDLVRRLVSIYEPLFVY